MGILATGWANYCSIVVWDEKVYFRQDDKFEKWDVKDPNINKTPDSVVNKDYVKLHKQGKFSELDQILSEVDSKTASK